MTQLRYTNIEPQSRHLVAPIGFMPPQTLHLFWSAMSVIGMNALLGGR